MVDIVIPCYNEAKRFPEAAFKTFFQQNPDYHFIFVNDGSKDQTLQMLLALEKYGNGRIEVINQKNQGKAAAVRAGMLHAAAKNQFSYIGFLDADFAATPENFNLFLTIAKEFNHRYVLLMGSRVKRLGAHIERKLSRHIIGRVVATIISSYILKLPSYDTQCGAKMFRKEVVTAIFDKPFNTKWLFDVEVILRLITNVPGSEKQILEIPLTVWEDKAGSNLTYKDALSVFREMWRIKRMYKR